MAKNARRQISLFVDGQQVEATAKNIAAAYKKASNELANMVVGSDDYISKLEEVQTLDGHLKKHRDSLRGIEQGTDLAKAGLDRFVGIAAGAFAVDSILEYGTALFGTATNMELMEKKARTVFGDTLPQVTAEAEKNAQAMGLTNSEYIAGAAAIQDLLVPMGFQRKEAAGISTQLNNLSGALSEWSGGQHSAREVSDILAKSLLGERDALNSLGIDIKQAEIDAELYARGLDKLTGASAKQAEATVTLDLILQKSTDAQAAFAEGSDSMARRSAELTAKFSEIKETLASALVPIFERLLALATPVVNAFAEIAGGIESIVDPAHEAGRAFDSQAAKVADLEKNMNPLLERYDELSTKSTLNKKEQAELKGIIEKVSETIPLAVTQFDEYGKAIGLNTDKAREFIATERARLQVINADAIDKYTESLRRESLELERLQKVVNSGKSVKEFGVFRQLSNEELQVAIKNLQEVQTKVTGINAEIARLKGDNIEIQPVVTAPTVNNGGNGKGTGKNKDADQEAERQKKEQQKREEDLQAHLARIQEIIETNQEKYNLSTLTSDEQEIEQIRLKYEKEIELAQSKFATETEVQNSIEELKAQRDEEIAAKLEEQRIARTDAEIEAYIEDQQRIDEAKAAYQEEKLAAEEEIKTFNQEALFTDRELELQQLEEHYATLLKTAEQYGIDTTNLKAAYAQKQAAIEKKWADKSTKEQQESLQARLAAMQAAFTAFGDFTQALFDLMGAEAEDNAQLQKVATLAKIAFDTAQAISSLIAASEANPTNSVTFGAAGAAQFVAGLARILVNVAQAKKVLSSAPKVTAQKAEGGRLEVTGADDGRTYQALPIQPPATGMLPGFPVLFTSSATAAPVLASERGAEYFVAAPDLKNPEVSYHVRMIENITHGRSITQFAEGGFNLPASNTGPQSVAAPGAQTTATTTLPSAAASAQDIAALAASIQQLAAAQSVLVALLQQGITAVIPDRTIIDINTRFDKINGASGGYFK